MDYHANVEAAVDFSKELWPQARAEFPNLRLKLVGSNPAPSIRALASEPGIEVTGTVPDIRPYYSAAVAAIVNFRLRRMRDFRSDTPTAARRVREQKGRRLTRRHAGGATLERGRAADRPSRPGSC